MLLDCQELLSPTSVDEARTLGHRGPADGQRQPVRPSNAISTPTIPWSLGIANSADDNSWKPVSDAVLESDSKSLFPGLEFSLVLGPTGLGPTGLYDMEVTATYTSFCTATAFMFLMFLHWLPIRQRILFKTAVLVYKCRHGMAPSYLSTYCMPTSSHDGRCHLRSAVSGQLSVPRTTTNYGHRSFTVSGPAAWNSLPAALWQDMSLSVFRRRLKTFLMT